MRRRGIVNCGLNRIESLIQLSRRLHCWYHAWVDCGTDGYCCCSALKCRFPRPFRAAAALLAAVETWKHSNKQGTKNW